MLHSSYVLEITSRLECLYQILNRKQSQIFSQFNGGDNMLMDIWTLAWAGLLQLWWRGD